MARDLPSAGDSYSTVKKFPVFVGSENS